MKKIFSLLVLFFIIISTNITFASSEDQSAISSFKDVVQKHMDSYIDDPRILVFNLNPDWLKTKAVVSNASFDVQRTNSIVSPYVGIMVYNMSVGSIKKSTKEAVENDNNFQYDLPDYLCRITFSYQNEKWVPTRYQFEIPKMGVRLADATYYERERMLVK